MNTQTNTVVPGFKALSPLRALSALNSGSALNPGTILLSYKEIVLKLKVDLNKTVSLKKLKRNGKNSINFQLKPKFVTKIAVFSVFSCKNHQITQYFPKKTQPNVGQKGQKRGALNPNCVLSILFKGCLFNQINVENMT